MSFFGTLALLAVGAGAVKLSIDKTKDYIYEKQAAYAEKKHAEHVARLFCRISAGEFERIVHKAESGIPRLVRVQVYNAQVLGIVESKSGLTEWGFTLDFDDCGSLTGNYTLSSGNEKSAIPNALGRRIQRELQNLF